MTEETDKDIQPEEELQELEELEGSQEPEEEQTQAAPTEGKWKRRMLNMLLHESDSDEEGDLKLKNIVRSLNGAWFFRQMPLVLIIVAFWIIRITSHYQWEQGLIEREALEKKIEDITIRAGALNSSLTEKTRQSMIERKLKQNGDSTLLPSVEEPYVININEPEE
ncbi:MAG: hypothetical protein LUC44_05655 [Prevotellaceae bacterium]|nr:hypothetical protein [Prevotellaceae bacterium]